MGSPNYRRPVLRCENAAQKIFFFSNSPAQRLLPVLEGRGSPRQWRTPTLTASGTPPPSSRGAAGRALNTDALERRENAQGREEQSPKYPSAPQWPRQASAPSRAGASPWPALRPPRQAPAQGRPYRRTVRARRLTREARRSVGSCWPSAAGPALLPCLGRAPASLLRPQLPTAACSLVVREPSLPRAVSIPARALALRLSRPLIPGPAGRVPFDSLSARINA